MVTIKRDGIQVTHRSQDDRRFATALEPGQENFLRQTTFAIDGKGGWLAQPEVPSLP
jgi:hypothetical protein